MRRIDATICPKYYENCIAKKKEAVAVIFNNAKQPL